MNIEKLRKSFTIWSISAAIFIIINNLASRPPHIDVVHVKVWPSFVSKSVALRKRFEYDRNGLTLVSVNRICTVFVEKCNTTAVFLNANSEFDREKINPSYLQNGYPCNASVRSGGTIVWLQKGWMTALWKWIAGRKVIEDNVWIGVANCLCAHGRVSLVLIPSCETPKITLDRTHKQYTTVHTSFYFLHDMMSPLMMIKGTISHIAIVDLQLWRTREIGYLTH